MDSSTPAVPHEVMERIFAPRSVAVVGVPRGMKTGRMFLEALQKPGFHGNVYPVNPNADEILGLETYPSVSAIGARIDIAIVVTPPGAAASVVEDCGKAGVAGVVMFTAGFDELGTDEGSARGAELLAVARQAGVRLVGPNCMGLYVPSLGLAAFPNMPAESGDVGFISQSGSLVSAFARDGATRGFALSKVVSMGNQLDLEAADFVRYFADDDATKLIAMYVEGARDGRRLFEALRYATERKPVVMWKSGRTEGGARAARSHTGALAGTNRLWEAMARQAGVVPAKTIHDLADVVVALRMHPRGAVRRLAIVTGPGGPSISATDAAEEAGLQLAELAEETIERLRSEISAVGTSPRNPVDVGLIMYGPMDVYARVTEIVGADPNVDGVVVIGGRGSGDGVADFADQMSAAVDHIGKPLALIGAPQDADVLRRYADAGIGVFPTAERAVRAFAALSVLD
ncbi:MAG TPA: CoA-binding protein [Dehalococcoidia bacterium]|nr:CoA-binding protein [Dehalococcoidia bacterium]